MTVYYVRTDGNDAASGLNDTNNPTTGAWLTLNRAKDANNNGNTIMIRASAGNAASYPTASLDYSFPYFTPNSSLPNNGPARWVGYNGRPTISTPGCALANCVGQYMENLYLVATSNANGNFGMLNFTGGRNCIYNCVLNMNNLTTLNAINVAGASEVIGCEIYGGTASPTFSSGSIGIYYGSASPLVYGCRIHHCRAEGVNVGQTAGGMEIRNNLIYNNAGDGVYTMAGGVPNTRIIGNTIHGNLGHGFRGIDAVSAMVTCVMNNNITGHTQAGKSGISLAQTNSQGLKYLWGWNNVWNNTTNYTNVTADATDLSIDPQYADAANGDFTPRATALEVAFPTAYVPLVGASKAWIGAMQPEQVAQLVLLRRGGSIMKM